MQQWTLLMEKTYVIYKHTSPSGKCYIGQTCDYNRRSVRHRVPSAKTECVAFYRAIQKYGWDNFAHDILVDNLTIDEANQLEMKFIQQYNSIYPNGYNLNSGGLNATPSEETRRKMSTARKGKQPHNKGVPMSEENKVHLSKLNKGKPKPESVRLASIGRIRTKETKEKIQRTQLTRPLYNEKTWIITNVLTGEQSITSKLTTWCANNGCNKGGIKSAFFNNRLYKQLWKIEVEPDISGST